MKSAIYAFSGDPITFGHLDIIKRAAAVFDRLVVAIGFNPQKKYLFSQEERTEMARRSLLTLKNVEVKSFQGMLVDFAYENNIDVIVKGVRSSQDFEYEQGLHSLGESQKLGIDTFILFAKPSLAHISSSAVKEIQQEQGLIQDYVPAYVKQCVEAKLSEQFIVGLTGEIGVGKSYVGQNMVALAKKMGLEAHNIELDHLSWQIQSDLKEEKYEVVRKQIIDTFGTEIANNDGSINRKILGEIVFANQKKLDKLNEIMETPILVRLRRELKKKKGLIFLNAALLVEARMSQLSNYNTILLGVDEKTQEERLLERGLTKEQIKRRLKSQYDFANKKKNLQKEIETNRQGRLWTLNKKNITLKDIEKLLGEILLYFGLDQ
ncbi:pantetheine-phosphate adenylyltransferase [Patescibacteria group bacterium]|nr:pantetheine-phosphate adenylyltransferase [Patescibacteria group bacterium]